MLRIKNWVCVFLAALCVFLCSCQFQEERIDSQYDEGVKPENKKEETFVPEESGEKENKISKQELQTLAASALEKLTAVPEYPDGYPTIDDVTAQYKKACEAVGWIAGTEKVATDSAYPLEAFGLTYYKVLPDCYLGSNDAGKNPESEKLIYNLETLEAYMATLMDAQSAEDYIIDISESFDIPKFIEDKNGELYALPYAFPAAGYEDDDAFALTPNVDGSYTLSVEYTFDDGEGKENYTYSVKYANVDSRWVFDNFRLVKQH